MIEIVNENEKKNKKNFENSLAEKKMIIKKSNNRDYFNFFIYLLLIPLRLTFSFIRFLNPIISFVFVSVLANFVFIYINNTSFFKRILHSDPDFESFSCYYGESSFEIDEVKKIISENVFCEEGKKELSDILFFSDFDNSLSRFKKNKEIVRSKKKRRVDNVIIFGDPGTGKTHIIELIAKKLSYKYMKISGGSFERLYVGSGASKLDKIISFLLSIEKKKPEKSGPIFLLIDEIDSLCRLKEANSSQDNTLINTFLTFIDSIERNNLDIVILGTTNVINLMEPASVREGRFHKVEFSFVKPSLDNLSPIVSSVLENYFYNYNWEIYKEGEIDLKDKKDLVFVSFEFIQKFKNKLIKKIYSNSESQERQYSNYMISEKKGLSFPMIRIEIDKIFKKKAEEAKKSNSDFIIINSEDLD